MTLDGQRQRVQHPLGGEEVRDDPLRDRDRLRRYPERLRIQPEIDDQLLRRAGDAAEIRVAGQRLRVVDLDLLSLRGGLGGGRDRFGGGSTLLSCSGLSSDLATKNSFCSRMVTRIPPHSPNGEAMKKLQFIIP